MRLRKRKKKRINTLVITVIALAAVLMAANYVMMNIFYQIGSADTTQPLPRIPDYHVSPPSVEGYEMVDVDTDPGTVYLNTECISLDMVTTEQQTSSIQNGIDGKVEFRPTTHDTAADILDGYRIDPIHVRIEKMEGGTYFAKLALKSGERVLTLDTRPTDAIAIAVRFGVPIYVKKELLETYGEDTC